MISHPSATSPPSIRQMSTTTISGPSGSRRRECTTTRSPSARTWSISTRMPASGAYFTT
jgi:hypothetical protein